MPSDILKEIERLRERTSERQETPMPPPWNVVLFNDDYTPHGLVVQCIAGVFNTRESEAVAIMLKANREGKAIVCNITQADVAESKCAQAMNIARGHGFPLVFAVEKA